MPQRHLDRYRVGLVEAGRPSSLTDADARRVAEPIPHIVWTATPDGSDWSYLVHPDDVDRAALERERARRTITPIRIDCRLRGSDGQYRWHACCGLPILDGQNAVAQWIGTATDIDEVKRSAAELQLANHEIQETLQLLETFLSKAPVGVTLVDRDCRIVHLNATLAAVSGSTVAAQRGRHVADVLPDLWPQLEPVYRRVLDYGESFLDVEIHRSTAGSEPTGNWLVSYYPVSSRDAVVGVGIVVVDITERRAVLRALGASERRLAMVQRSAHVGSFGWDAATDVSVAGTLLDDGARIRRNEVRHEAETYFEIGFEQAAIGTAIAGLHGYPTRVNPALCALLGRPAEELVGRVWAAFNHPDEVPLHEAVAARVVAGHDTHEDERRFLRPDGTTVWASSHVTLVRDERGDPQYFFVQLQDITRRKKVEQELSHLALHDPLTGLPNRVLLTDRLTQSLALSRRRGTKVGVLVLDLDHFKDVNDSFGHDFGDHLLHHAGDQIVRAVRPGDTVARIDGDEFVVVCDDVSHFEIEQIATRVLATLSQPCTIGTQEVAVGASIGVVMAEPEATPEGLLRDGDAAMYRAKERGRGRTELFDEGLRSKNEQRLATTAALHGALARKEFVVYYQPIVDLETGAMVSAEALLRWQHPSGVLIGPDEFIPVAEDSGLIIPIGAWVLEQACRQLTQWQRTNPAMAVAVNLSVRQLLAPDISPLLAAILARTAATPDGIWLELTESVFMEDVEYFTSILDGLKAQGVRLAIDDFGTGYSSLSYLKRFPLDAVKVDRTFVDGLGTDAHDSALVSAVIAMARALGLGIIAEGVETSQQLGLLRGLGCPTAQGFYFARPLPADAMSELVARKHRWDVT